ncbi:WhiB family transcriptional regulator [Candidatus Saccharibacteria bacterium]|nr:WhiB family transcriptional regulator [Candidatus Saccharibacteria bacterium]
MVSKNYEVVPLNSTQANCKDVGLDFFATEHEGTIDYNKRAKKELLPVCASCAIKSACLEWALENNEGHGVWGGMTPTQRRELQRRGVRTVAS